jgi:hypothetical protein
VKAGGVVLVVDAETKNVQEDLDTYCVCREAGNRTLQVQYPNWLDCFISFTIYLNRASIPWRKYKNTHNIKL